MSAKIVINSVAVPIDMHSTSTTIADYVARGTPGVDRNTLAKDISAWLQLDSVDTPIKADAQLIRTVDLKTYHRTMGRHAASNAGKSFLVAGLQTTPRQKPSTHEEIIFGLPWKIRSTPAHGDHLNLLATAYQSLWGSDPKEARDQVALLRSHAKSSPKLLTALQFLADNRALMGSNLTPKSCTRVATLLAQQSPTQSATPQNDVASETPNLPFYTSVLSAVLYTAKPNDWVINHRNGSSFPVPGLASGALDFHGSQATLTQTAPLRENHPITGGFANALSLPFGYGTYARIVDDQQIDTLLNKFGDQIDDGLIPATRAISKDLYVYRALEEFLAGGDHLIGSTHSGRYIGHPHRAQIFVGLNNVDSDGRSTVENILFHELTHYVFDKADSILAEAVDGGGADHPAIDALDTRFLILANIRTGQSPLAQTKWNLGNFLEGPDFYPSLQGAINSNNHEALSNLIDDEDFITQVVSTGLCPSASSIVRDDDGGHIFSNSDKEYLMTPSDAQDLAVLWAQNAVLLRHALVEAASVAQKTGIPLVDVFTTSQWQDRMSTFVRAFVITLEQDPTAGVVALERSLRRKQHSDV